MRHLQLRLPAVLGMLAVVVAALAGPADAKVVERGEFEEAFSADLEDFCDVPGLAVNNSGTMTVAYTLKSRGSGPLYYAEHGRLSNRITNLANGKYVTALELTLNKDLKVTDLGGGLLDILVLATGNFTVWNSDGKAISRNPGQVRFRLLIDIHDPADPEDDEELSFELVKGSTGRSDDFCADVVPALL